jgi:hypothetical protein
MSYPLEKQPGKNQGNTSRPSQSLTDWERFDAMDDDDIIFDSDNPEIQPGELQRKPVRLSGITPTPEQIDEAKQQVFAYITRPRRSSSAKS